MTRQRYSKKESINRLLRLFQGNAVAQDTPETIQDIVLSEDEALSDLAELFAGSLPNETLTLPTAIPEATDVVSGIVRLATVVEANAGTDDTIALTPYGHTVAHEYGGIYAHTGTVAMVLTASTWAKITGTFQNEMLNSGSEVDGDWVNAQIVVNELGTYLVLYNIAMWTWAGTTPKVDVQAYVNGVAQVATRQRAQFGASGTIVHISGAAPVSIATLAHAIDLRINPDANATVHFDTIQLFVEKQNG